MKAIFFTLLFQIQISWAQNIICSQPNFVVVPQSTLKMLHSLGQAFMAYESTPSNNKYAQITKAIGASVQNLKSGASVNVGDKIETGPGQKVVLRFFMPIEQKITIEENSTVLVNALPTDECISLITVTKGKVTTEGEHENIQATEKCLTKTEVQTSNVEISPKGTKYSVDLSAAIAEANGEPIQEENYTVEKGSIQIKLKRARPNKKSEQIAKNGTFKLKAGQKAKVKINQRTKVADIEVIEP
jgi:hypothetical protein